MAGRFIKLYDKILNWEWYHDINTFRLFIHLLLKANYKDSEFKGQTIHRGQLVTSLPSLAADTSLTIRQVRDSLDKLKMTGEVTNKSFTKYRVITIVRYDDYQASDRQNGRQTADNTADKRQTNDRQNGSAYRNIEKIEEIDKEEHPTGVRRNAQRFIPPTQDEVRLFCQENGLSVDAERFCDYYASKGWKVGSSPMKDWRAACRNWAKRDAGTAPAAKPRKQSADNFDQRDYSSVPEDDMAGLAAEMAAFLRGEERT